MLYMPTVSRIIQKVQLMTCFVTMFVSLVQLPPLVAPYLPVYREEVAIVQPVAENTYGGVSEYRLIEPHH
jgi:hypothetical protein